MYLYDYQRTQLRKIRTGGNFIIQGSRSVGVTSILLNCALVHAGDYPGDTIGIFMPSGDMCRDAKYSLSDILYASKSGNVSLFDKSLDVSFMRDDIIKFTNGSVIRFSSLGVNPAAIRGESIDLLIIDNAMKIKNIDELFPPIFQQSRKCLIGFTGGFVKKSFIHHLYLNSLRGKNDFDYIRLPYELIPSLKEEGAMDKLKRSFLPYEWDCEMEMMDTARTP